MHEPVLTANGKDKSYFAFRILYLPTWGHPVTLRYEKRNEGATWRAVILSGDGGYPSVKKIIKQTEGEVKQSEVDDIFTSLDRTGFWRLPQKNDVQGLDGSEFVVEVIREGKYRVLSRWTPTDHTDKRGLTGILDLSRRLFRQVGFGEQIPY